MVFFLAIGSGAYPRPMAWVVMVSNATKTSGIAARPQISPLPSSVAWALFARVSAAMGTSIFA